MMSDYLARVKLKPQNYEVKHDIGLVFFWIPLAEMRSPWPVLISLEQNRIGTHYDLTTWLHNLMKPETGWLIIVFQMVQSDKREPVEVIVSNDDGVVELARVPLQQTRVERLSFAYIEAELEHKSHRVEILLGTKS